ncbi:hypothetical protein [Pseudomonas sp. 35 E 8]|nr:hypothetical protein [Pseudomonas sp. 35 E 8]CRM40054.1 hypothetical protein [Pseudomonas sp. 35 E 8]
MFLVLTKSLATTFNSRPAVSDTLPALEPIVLPVKVISLAVPLCLELLMYSFWLPVMSSRPSLLPVNTPVRSRFFSLCMSVRAKVFCAASMVRSRPACTARSPVLTRLEPVTVASRLAATVTVSPETMLPRAVVRFSSTLSWTLLDLRPPQLLLLSLRSWRALSELLTARMLTSWPATNCVAPFSAVTELPASSKFSPATTVLFLPALTRLPTLFTASVSSRRNFLPWEVFLVLL